MYQWSSGYSASNDAESLSNATSSSAVSAGNPGRCANGANAVRASSSESAYAVARTVTIRSGKPPAGAHAVPAHTRP
jgi:hypothetical protein